MSRSSGSRALHYNEEYARRVRKALSPVDMNLSGTMMGDLTARFTAPIEGMKSMTVEPRFASQRSRVIAGYHNEENLGASPSRIKRRFLYLTREEGDEIANAMIAELLR